MATGFFHVPNAVNEPVKGYAPGSSERQELQQTLADLQADVVEIPMVIDGKNVTTQTKVDIYPPHNLQQKVGFYHKGGAKEANMAIEAALKAKDEWAAMPWEHRISIFLKAAELLAGPWRAKINAATMIAQSKNAFQAEIDAACELIDFWRFNAQFASEMYNEQPMSSPGVWNRMEYRPLDGFVFAITPFNFTSICANLGSAPAMMGNTVVWKPSDDQIYSAHFLMELYKEAGLPDGVINIVYGDGPEIGDVIFNHPQFAGLHFTGSTGVFKNLWKTIGANIDKYVSYPRVVGETGGKDFIVAHETAQPKALATAISRGAFEYQGQKCSAASRCYIPSSIWPQVRDYVVADVQSMKMGAPDDFGNFVNAVINERSFDKLAGFIEEAKASPDAEIIVGGGYNKSVGYFIEPTIIVTTNPNYSTMRTELFGPVLTIYVYDPADVDGMLQLVNSTSDYALTGAIFGQDRHVLVKMANALQYAAGNFYINDKPTGAVVGQQPFGGSRASGTNDKAGSKANLMRWVSARTIKETFVPPTDYRYPFLG
ncbi:L-glutamate gamma-semialdehyde dehydrogenase [bacterium]|nr:L-glutamate gamma-semialdehyde dehydrogenase [bacterium]